MQPAFYPGGKTIRVDGATTAPSGVQAVFDTSGPCQFRLHNAGIVTVYVGFATTAALAVTNTVIPTGSGDNAKYAMPLPAGAIEVISAPRDSFWSAITASSTANVFITPGGGL